jgi:hypothetical protein
LLITILTVISLYSSFSIALEISLDFPEKVKINEEFIVSIDADTLEIYDIKIFAHSSEDKEIKSNEYISEIFKEDWSNPWFYLQGSFPSVKEYSIRVIKSPGENEICARLRKPGTSSIYTECSALTILDETESKNEITEEEISDEPTDPELEQKELSKLNESNKKVTATQTTPEEAIKDKIVPISTKQINPEKIILNFQEIEPEIAEVTTKTQKKKLWILYGFLALCVIIIMLLALRKL